MRQQFDGWRGASNNDSVRIFPIFGQPYDSGLAIVLLALLYPGWNALGMILRMSRPIRDDDAKAIARAFDGKDIQRIEKLWFGGPWSFFEGRSISPHQVGRPYRVVLVGDDQGQPRIVADGTDARGDPVLRQHGPGGWTVISHVRPLPPPLVLTS